MKFYVSVDLDEPSIFEVVQSWTRLQELGGDVKGRVSSSGSGIHLVGDGIDVNSEKAVEERLYCGDDKYRVHLDVVRDYRPPQTLFDVKQGKRAGEWTRNLDHLIGEYRRCNPYVA